MRSCLNELFFNAVRRWVSSTAAALCPLCAIAAAETNALPQKFSPDQIELYQKEVQPILAENCYKCHSHQAEKIKGSFLLDSRAALLKGGETGPAIIPGDPEKSL